MNEKFLKNKIALVTGGSRGIGKAIVLMLAEAGCDVAFTFRQNEAAAKEVEKLAAAQGVRTKASCVDVKDFNAVKVWVDSTRQEFGALDILVNNAGIIRDKALMMMTPEEWQEVIDTNLTGMFNAARASVVTFLKQKRGDIINISSISGVFGLARQVNYSASKGGMNAFTKALAKETAGYGVRVNAVAPGFIDTDILAGFTEQQREQIFQTVPLGRIGKVDDVANCVKFLLSEPAQYITGQVIVVDGGLAIR